MSPLETPDPDFRHLVHMTDERGTFEHALFSEPRPEHGYCSDDMARVLVVATRERTSTPALHNLAKISLRFLLDALDAQGKCRNRMNQAGDWEDRPAVEDCWGRTIWGLGTAAAHCDDHLIRQFATTGLEQAMRQRSPWPRAMAFAALGAAEIVERRSRQCVCPRSVVRCRCRIERTQPTLRLAVARTATDLRQCDAPRSNDCGRDGTGASGPPSRAGWTSWSGCSTTRTETAISRSPRRGAVVPTTLVHPSISSPLRWRRSPMPVPAPRLLTATDGGWAGRPLPPIGFSVTTTRGW